MEGNTTILYLVRHGETDANISDIVQGQLNVPLNENGMRQAESVGERLKDFPFDVIYSSDLDRARITAEHIAAGREITFDSRLREWNLGNWQGKYMSEIEQLYPDEYKAYRNRLEGFVPGGGESVFEFRDRAASVISEIAEKNAGKKILCVAHGGFLRVFLMSITGAENYPRAQTDNTCICRFHSANAGKTWKLVTWNDVTHLENSGIICRGW